MPNTPAELEAAELRAQLEALQKKMEASGLMDAAAQVDMTKPAPDGGPQVVGYHKKVITQKYPTIEVHPVVDGSPVTDRVIKVPVTAVDGLAYVSVAEVNGTVENIPVVSSEPEFEPEPEPDQSELDEARSELLQMDMTLLRAQPECAEIETLPRIKADLVEAILQVRFA